MRQRRRPGCRWGSLRHSPHRWMMRKKKMKRWMKKRNLKRRLKRTRSCWNLCLKKRSLPQKMMSCPLRCCPPRCRCPCFRRCTRRPPAGPPCRRPEHASAISSNSSWSCSPHGGPGMAACLCFASLLTQGMGSKVRAAHAKEQRACAYTHHNGGLCDGLHMHSYKAVSGAVTSDTLSNVLPYSTSSFFSSMAARVRCRSARYSSEMTSGKLGSSACSRTSAPSWW